jgi:hypothetical protein
MNTEMTESETGKYLFDRIVLPNLDSRYRVSGSPADEAQLGPLAKINIFVGPNNSGKSRLMRALASIERLPAIRTLIVGTAWKNM